MNDGPTGKRTIVYTRVSRDDTGEGKSNERQAADCRSFAELRGLTIVDEAHDISVSAYTGKKRPEWARVLDAVRAGDVDVILAWKVDRITRTVRDLVAIIDLCQTHNVSVATVDGELDLSTSQGRAVATILGSISQMEVERKGERQRSANAQRRAAGQPWRSGWASFGYDRDKRIVPAQADMIRRAADAVLDGASLKSIAREWRESGTTTPRSSKGAQGWTHNGVKSILLNPVNAGINTYRGKEIGPGAWEAIIPEATLRQLQALLGDPARRTTTRASGRRAENLLSGIATCATCGSKVQAGSSNGKKVYKCTNLKGEHITTLRSEADSFVLASVTSGDMFASSRVLPDLATAEGQEEVQVELNGLNRREAAITGQFSRGAISENSWASALASITEQREALNAKLAEAEGADHTQAALSKARVSNFLSLSLADKRATLGAAVEIQLHPRNRRRNVPIEQQVSIWARERSWSPLVAGTHPDSLKRQDELFAEREAALAAELETRDAIDSSTNG